MNLTTLFSIIKQKNVNPFYSFKVIAIGTLALAGNKSSAQQGFYIGLNTGVQTSSLLNKTDQAAGAELNYTQKVSVPVGIGGGYTFNKHFGVELDIIYSKQGQAYNGKYAASPDSTVYSTQIEHLAELNNMNIAPNSNYTADVVLNCLKVPVMLHYTGNTSKKVFFNSFIGPQINMLNSVVFHVNGQQTPLTGTNITPIDVYKKTTLDGVLGVGAGINLSSHLVLTADLRLDYGFGDVENKGETLTYKGSVEDYYPTSGRAATHNATGGLMVGIYYKFVKKAKDTKEAKGKK